MNCECYDCGKIFITHKKRKCKFCNSENNDSELLEKEVV